MKTLKSVALCSSLAFGVLAVATFTSEANACGGLFCNSANPVNQAAERIIFAQNDDGTVTAAIEILYEGPANQFAWVLPVPPGETEVGVSSKNALDRLDQQSNPQYSLTRTFEDGCSIPRAATGNTSDPSDNAGEDDDGVIVVAEGNAGPYSYKQIMVDPELAEPADVAVNWLEENEFDVTALGPKLLGQYLEQGMNLLAFKLQKGKTSGSIRPVLLTYKSKRPMIPIQPTAVAANEDMGVKVWVLGDSRAVSSNYPDLVLNESLINWFNPDTNYNDVVIAAGNEAGGQGFVTEQSGPAGAFAQAIYQDFEGEMWEQLRTGRYNSLEEFLQRTTNFAGYDGYNDVMLDPELVPVREGATNEQLLSCIGCYFQADVPVRTEAYPETSYPGETDPIHSLNESAFLKKFYELVIEPLEKTRALFEDHAMVTRFYTTLSPDEMTFDPEFVFNPELPDVSNVHTATQILSCEEDGWRVELPQGMVIRGEGTTWPVPIDQELPANLRVVQLSTKGDGEVLTDNTASIATLLTELKLGEAMPTLTDPDGDNTDDDGSGKNPLESDVSTSDGGCSVAHTPSANWGFLAAFALVLPMLRRRRSRRQV